MKKLLATTLALSMAASMTAVPFAADRTASIKVDETSKLYLADSEGVLTEVADGFRAKPGQTIYVQLLPGNPGEEISGDLLSKHKVVANWDHGAQYVEGTKLEMKKTADQGAFVYGGSEDLAALGLQNSYATQADAQAAIEAAKEHTDDACTAAPCTDDSHFNVLSADRQAALLAAFKAETGTSYRAVAAIQLKSGLNTKLDDLIGTVKVLKKTNSSGTEAPVREITAEIGFGEVMADDSIEIDNDNPIVNFKGFDGEVELVFGNAAVFTVDINDQGRIYLGYDQKPNFDIINQNPDADIEFLSFEGTPTFNKNGELRLYAEEAGYLYRLTAKGLQAVDAEYDEDEGAYILQTRTLGSYVLSNEELSFDVQAEDGENGGSQGGNQSGKPNPDTGR